MSLFDEEKETKASRQKRETDLPWAVTCRMSSFCNFIPVPISKEKCQQGIEEWHEIEDTLHSFPTSYFVPQNYLFIPPRIVQEDSCKLNMRLKFLNGKHQNQSENLWNWTEILLESLKSNGNGGLTKNFLFKNVQSFYGNTTSWYTSMR